MISFGYGCINGRACAAGVGLGADGQDRLCSQMAHWRGRSRATDIRQIGRRIAVYLDRQWVADGHGLGPLGAGGCGTNRSLMGVANPSRG